MKNKQILLLLVLVAAVFTVGFLGFSFKKNVVASVEGDAITLQDLQDRIKTYPPQFSAALQQKENRLKVLDQMIDEKTLLVAAKKAGIEKQEDFKKQMEAAHNQLLLSIFVRDKIEKGVVVTDEDVRRYFMANPVQFQEVEQRRARHILVKNEQQAKELLKRVQTGGNFAALAKQNSQDPSASNGGDLGWFNRGQLVPDFEHKVYSMKKGEVGLVKTQFGYHVVQLTDMNVRPKLDYEKVKAQIKDGLITEKRRTMTNDYLARLKKDYKIKKDASKI